MSFFNIIIGPVIDFRHDERYYKMFALLPRKTQNGWTWLRVCYQRRRFIHPGDAVTAGVEISYYKPQEFTLWILQHGHDNEEKFEDAQSTKIVQVPNTWYI